MSAASEQARHRVTRNPAEVAQAIAELRKVGRLRRVRSGLHENDRAPVAPQRRQPPRRDRACPPGSRDGPIRCRRSRRRRRRARAPLAPRRAGVAERARLRRSRRRRRRSGAGPARARAGAATMTVTPAAPSRKRCPRVGWKREPTMRSRSGRGKQAQEPEREGREARPTSRVSSLSSRCTTYGHPCRRTSSTVGRRTISRGVKQCTRSGPRPSGNAARPCDASSYVSTGNGGRPTSSTLSAFSGTAMTGEYPRACEPDATASTCSALLPVKSQWLTRTTFVMRRSAAIASC